MLLPNKQRGKLVVRAIIDKQIFNEMPSLEGFVNWKYYELKCHTAC